MIKKILNLPVWALLIILALLSVAILFIFSSLNPWNPLTILSRPDSEVDTSRSAVVREIQSLQRLETASYTIEKIIEAGYSGNAFQNILYGDRLLLVAHGRVVAGVELADLREQDVQVDGETLVIQLPATEIFFTSLDNNQTKVYDRQQGFLARADKDLESEARLAAEGSIRQAACDDGILQEAATNAQRQIGEMYRLAGFDQVAVRVSAGTCR